jgi:prepilin-type N-terminal cleavage/methylation domain-containing protein
MRNGLLKEAGVTLTELMVVLAIIAVASAIAAPMFISSLPHKRLKSATMDLVTDLRNARSLAVSDNTPYFLCWTSDTTYQIDKVEDPPSTADCGDDNTPTKKTVDFKNQYRGVQFGYKAGVTACGQSSGSVSDAFKFTGDRATFNSHGAAVNGPDSATVEIGGALYLTNTEDSDQETYCIEVEGTTGRAKAYRWDAETSTWVS